MSPEFPDYESSDNKGYQGKKIWCANDQLRNGRLYHEIRLDQGNGWHNDEKSCTNHDHQCGYKKKEPVIQLNDHGKRTDHTSSTSVCCQASPDYPDWKWLPSIPQQNSSQMPPLSQGTHIRIDN
jgi:hypothetical protein